jgi:hypothetical protein
MAGSLLGYPHPQGAQRALSPHPFSGYRAFHARDCSHHVFREQNPLVVFGSLALGGLLGEALAIETRFEALWSASKNRVSKGLIR